jgi:rod shape-determining protein MreB and related proteins
VGGGSLLRGLDKRIERETQVPVRMVEQPLEAVVLGAGHCVESYDKVRELFMQAGTDLTRKVEPPARQRR